MIEPLGWASGALALAGVLMVCALSLRRVALTWHEQRRIESEQRLQPLALALLEDEATPVPTLSDHEARVLAALLTRYARQLSGAALANVAAFFERRGYVERELANLSSGRSWKRATAAYVLGGMASRRAAPSLIERLEDPDREVAAAAARSLGRLGDPSAVEPLVAALAHGRLPRAACAHALLSLGPAALPELHSLLAEADDDADLKEFVVELIGLLGGGTDATVLVGLLRDPSAEVRARAARALGRLGAEEAATELRAALGDRIPFVRANVAHALGAIGDRRAIDALLVQAHTDGFDPAQAAADAVARIDPDLLRAAREAANGNPHLAHAADVAELRR
jgi:HEAT repeat protein